MATNSQLVDYCLYDFNDKKGRVPFLDDATARGQLKANLINILNVSP